LQIQSGGVVMQERELYNEAVKEKYLAFEMQNETSLRNYFYRIEPFEKTIGKDISFMNTQELMEIIEAFKFSNHRSASHFISLIRGYVNWTRLECSNDNDAIFKISVDDVTVKQGILTRMFKNPKHLRECLELAYKYQQQENRAIRDSLVWWLFYAGIAIENLGKLKKTDMNQDGTIFLDGVSYSLSPEAQLLWKMCSQLVSIEKDGSRYDKDLVYSTLVSNDYLFRTIAGQKLDYNKQCNPVFFRTIVERTVLNYNETTGEGKAWTPLNTRLSGIFYRMYQLEQNGQLSNELTASLFMPKSDFKNIPPLNLKKWVADYNNWKLAFELK
jgi:hypothetical protein